MSFLHTLATLAQHAVQTAEAPFHQNQPQPQAQPAQYPTTRYEDGSARVGNINTSAAIANSNPMLQAPQAGPMNSQQILQHLAGLGGLQMQSPNLGSPDYQSDPQGGFGMQVQNIGGAPQQLQAPYSPWQNMTGHPQNYVNPQVQDNGYTWYQ